jgi:hypothetical protein
METTERKNYLFYVVNNRGRVVVTTSLTGVTEREMICFCTGLSYDSTFNTRYVAAYEKTDNGLKLAKEMNERPKSFNHRLVCG